MFGAIQIFLFLIYQSFFFSKILKSGRALTEELDHKIRPCFDKLRKEFPESGLAVTKEELSSIVKAVGLAQGHWYKCPNGK